MSLGPNGVFQVMKKVTFQRILIFWSSRKWGCFFGHLYAAQCVLVGGGVGSGIVVYEIGASRDFYHCGHLAQWI
jgi:hypothetical protein